MFPTPQIRRSAADCGFTLHEVPADPAGAAAFRHHFTPWLTGDVAATAPQRADIVLAVYEAVANAAEHAYYSGPQSGTLDIDAHYQDRGRVLEVTVTDHGTWKPPENNPARGRGLPLINLLSGTVDITTGHAGTTVHLRWDQLSQHQESSH